MTSLWYTPSYLIKPSLNPLKSQLNHMKSQFNHIPSQLNHMKFASNSMKSLWNPHFLHTFLGFFPTLPMSRLADAVVASGQCSSARSCRCAAKCPRSSERRRRVAAGSSWRGWAGPPRSQGWDDDDDDDDDDDEWDDLYSSIVVQ